MTLDRRACLSLCFVSVILMSGSGFLLWSRWDKLSRVLPTAKRPASRDAVMATFSAGTGWPSGPAAAAKPSAKTISVSPAPGVPSSAAPPSSATSTVVGTGAPGAVSTPLARVSKPGAAKVSATPAAEPGRKILFTLRNSRPSRVEITGSFNNWTPVPFVKGENHVWEIALTLIPGEYTYNFLVDGKAIRDPNNPRTAPEGRSLLVVKPK